MKNALAADEASYRLTFDRQMTFAFATELEDMIIDALRRYKCVEVDLSKVVEIDLYGTHLLGLLQSFFGKGVVVVGTSPAVEKVYGRLASPRCATSAPPAARREAATAKKPAPAHDMALRRSA